MDRRASFPIFVRSIGYQVRRLVFAPHAGRFTPLAYALAGAHCATIDGDWEEPSGESRFKQGETDMADKGKKDKGRREQQKKAQLTPKEKRKKKKEKKK